MNVYFCGRWGRREELRRYADQAATAGLVVVSRWLTSTDDDAIRDPGYLTRYARADLADLDVADVLVCFTEAGEAAGGRRGGRHVEYGYALALGRRLVVVGPAENCFHALADARFEDWPRALEFLARDMPPPGR